jgi:hypothetical protein
MPTRRFSPPWSVEELDVLACFVVRDNGGQKLACVYFVANAGATEPPSNWLRLRVSAAIKSVTCRPALPWSARRVSSS